MSGDFITFAPEDGHTVAKSPWQHSSYTGMVWGYEAGEIEVDK